MDVKEEEKKEDDFQQLENQLNTIQKQKHHKKNKCNLPKDNLTQHLIEY